MGDIKQEFSEKGNSPIRLHSQALTDVKEENDQHDRKFFCDQCEDVFVTDNELDYHINNTHATYHCDKCEYSASEEKNLKDHIKYRHDGASFGPSIWEEHITDSLEYKEMNYTHDESDQFDNKVIANILSPEVKMEEDFYCDKCNFISTQESDLRKHNKM